MKLARPRIRSTGSRSPRSAPACRGVRTLAALAGAMLLALGTAGAARAAAGDPDPAFGVHGKVMFDFNQSTDIANAVAVQPDGKLVVVGTTYVNNDYSGEDFAVARLNPDGSLDASFGANGRVQTNFPGLAAVASSVVIQPDGKIVVAGGAFPQFTFLGDFEVVRYNSDGSLDATFGNGGIVTTSFPGQGSYAFALALQPDGRIVAAGTDFLAFSTEASSNTDFALARYLPNGALDPSFGSGGTLHTDFAGGNDDAFSILIQPDGKLVAVGAASSAATWSDFAAARYSSTGVLDATFGIGGKVRTDLGAASFDQARSAALQKDGRIVAAGLRNFNNGLSQPFALVRWDAAGALDPTFDGDGKLAIDFNSFLQSAYAVLVQPDGKIISVGFADTEGSDSDFLLARCKPDGSLDPTFGIGGKVRTSFGDLNGGAKGALLQPDGKVVAVGFQATFSAQWSEFAVARYAADAWINEGGALAGAGGAPLLVGTGTLAAGSAVSIDLSNAHANAAAVLFAATSSTPVPFVGGTLLAFPVFAALPFTIGGAGTFDIGFTVPAGIPSGTQLWLQWAIADAGAAKGVALSNAIMSAAP